MPESNLQKELKTFSISQIATFICIDWVDAKTRKSKVNYAAKPYLDAMHSLIHINDRYMNDTGDSVVRYFLCNASSWRGDIAKAVKAELKRRLV